MKKKIGIHQFYALNPFQADQLLWGQENHSPGRRAFLRRSALLTMGMALGAEVVFGQYMPSGLIPAAFAHSDQDFELEGKHPDLIILNDRPWNVETPPHLLDDLITTPDKFFVRNNGLVPSKSDFDNWTLTIEGESAVQRKVFTLAELKSKFKHYTYRLTLECGGNGRSEFYPPAEGNQWKTGAVGCSEWTGVRLKDVLQSVGIKQDAVYIGYYGKDKHLSGSKDAPISRGVPIAKAMEDESLIAFAMNGKDIPLMNGFPLRLVFGGWVASTSGKWLNKIVLRNKIHDGPKMTGQSYRMPCEAIAPGSKVEDKDMCIIESMPVKSLLTYPKSGAMIKFGKTLAIRGHAWAGDLTVKAVHYSIDFGMSWKTCTLQNPANRFAWQHFQAQVSFPKKGYYEIWARATDSKDLMQPMVVPGWNPHGYLNNACHRIAVKVV